MFPECLLGGEGKLRAAHCGRRKLKTICGELAETPGNDVTLPDPIEKNRTQCAQL